MTGICPALERALSFTNVATLIPLSGYQTPQQLREAGRGELIAYLRANRALHTAKTADTALVHGELQRAPPSPRPRAPPTRSRGARTAGHELARGTGATPKDHRWAC